MSEEISPAGARRHVRFELKRLREQAGKTQEDVAKRLKCVPSKISHIESGRNLPDRPDVEIMWSFYNRPAAELEEFWAFVEAADSNQPVVLTSKNDPLNFNVYVNQEFGAQKKATVDTNALDGLLQPRIYMRPMLKFFNPDITAAELDASEEARERRAAVLTRETNPLEMDAVVAWHVLLAEDTPPEDRRKLYEHLLTLTALDNVKIWSVLDRKVDDVHKVTPGAMRSVHGPFTSLKFSAANDPGLVYVDAGVRGLIIEGVKEIAFYDGLHKRLRDVAVPPSESRRLIEKLWKDVM